MATFTATNGIEIVTTAGEMSIEGPDGCIAELSAEAIEAVQQYFELRSIGGL